LPSDLFKGFLGSNFIEDFFNNSILSNAHGYLKTDIRETEKEYLMEAELPGFEKENIHVDYHDGILSIHAHKDDVLTEENDNYVRRERHYGTISRSYHVEGIKEDQIKASYKDGILKLILPKSETARQNRRVIDIN
jgi:HSP20 family protein